jgi:N-formylglutamate deformylase
VLFWDAHSIRRNVKTIQENPFPDLILGNNDEKTSGIEYINIALKNLSSGSFEITHNTPFKGGFITRSKGNPSQNIHALQLEMCKDLYMKSNETEYDPVKAITVKKVLKKTFNHLIEALDA